MRNYNKKEVLYYLEMLRKIGFCSVSDLIKNFNRDLSEELKNDKEVGISLVRTTPYLYEILSDNLKNDLDISEIAILKVPELLKLASHQIKDNKEFVNKVILESTSAFKYASLRLRGDKDIILSTKKSKDKSSHVSGYFNPAIFKDVEFIKFLEER